MTSLVENPMCLIVYVSLIKIVPRELVSLMIDHEETDICQPNWLKMFDMRHHRLD